MRHKAVGLTAVRGSIDPPDATNSPAAQPVVLIVAFPTSIHTNRWLNMVRGRGIRFVLFPLYGELPQDLPGSRVVRDAGELATLPESSIGIFDLASVDAADVRGLDARLGYVPWTLPSLYPAQKLSRPAHLIAAIRRFRPLLVHSMEVQFNGYLCLATKDHMGTEFPKWLLSNWGSDIILYRKLRDHRPRLLRIASAIDGYISECERDARIIRQMGFRGIVFPPMPASGGIDFSRMPALTSLLPPSQRREILIKGYHGWSGRAQHILSAVHLAAPTLRRFALRITMAEPGVPEMAAALAEWDGLDIACEPYLDGNDHARRLERLRAVVGLGISDGISTTLLDAMATGAFPIQADTSCGCEWIVPDETGILVNVHDIAALAAALRRAATDDRLVDAAALHNRSTVEARWNRAINGVAALNHYRSMAAYARDGDLAEKAFDSVLRQ